MRDDLKILLVLFAVLGLGELTIRGAESSLSLDVQHLETLPALAEEIDQAPGCRVLFLGNSLTRHGVDVDRFAEAARASSLGAVSAYVAHPDDTTIFEWRALYEHLFGERRPPDVLVVGFAGGQLADAPVRELQVSRLARWYSDVDDVVGILRDDLSGLGNRIDFLLSKAFRSYASRERLGRRVLDMLVPGYRQGRSWLHEQIKRKTEGPSASSTEEGSSARTFSQLDRLLKATRAKGVNTVIVAMPQPKAYPVDDVRAAADAGGATLLDFRRLPASGESYFLDGYHLNADGADRYTDQLFDALAKHQLAPCTAPAR